MDVLIFGGSGFVGQHLARTLQDCGHAVYIASRHDRPVAAGTVRPYQIDRLPALLDSLGDDYAIVNLAGESINSGRWSPARKERILTSRLHLTQAIVQAISQTNKKPSVLINASAVGYYGYSETTVFTENFPPGKGFLADVTNQWENAVLPAEESTRVVRLRLGVVLGQNGGALGRMVLPYRLFIGGKVGTGKQWLSWIHVEDVARLIHFSMQTPAISGPVNATAPKPVTMNQFGRSVAGVLKRPHWLPVPAFALELLLGEMAEIILQGQHAVPQAALEHQFTFRYADLDTALQNLLGTGR
ncbi:TIGR01777 family protein [Brevibacillus fluminis]|uniref:TIGR01777 family protein n=1 Tax=Brevibacillus fluminis TaxID=511487 RepID=A0A3M8DR85_9BACL|nr:TIGR01777 family oxidoreductase [Brevibacillus fluminis]RNB90656.1 TIGR01777 family protein [Brevibacillus fluminis]